MWGIPSRNRLSWGTLRLRFAQFLKNLQCGVQTFGLCPRAGWHWNPSFQAPAVIPNECEESRRETALVGGPFDFAYAPLWMTDKRVVSTDRVTMVSLSFRALTVIPNEREESHRVCALFFGCRYIGGTLRLRSGWQWSHCHSERMWGIPLGNRLSWGTLRLRLRFAQGDNLRDVSTSLNMTNGVTNGLTYAINSTD